MNEKNTNMIDTSCVGFTVKGNYCKSRRVHNTSFCNSHLKQVRSFTIGCCYTEGRTKTGGVMKACTQPATNDTYPHRCDAHMNS